jgi:hypothetical protein
MDGSNKITKKERKISEWKFWTGKFSRFSVLACLFLCFHFRKGNVLFCFYIIIADDLLMDEIDETNTQL